MKPFDYIIGEEPESPIERSELEGLLYQNVQSLRINYDLNSRYYMNKSYVFREHSTSRLYRVARNFELLPDKQPLRALIPFPNKHILYAVFKHIKDPLLKRFATLFDMGFWSMKFEQKFGFPLRPGSLQPSDNIVKVVTGSYESNYGFMAARGYHQFFSKHNIVLYYSEGITLAVAVIEEVSKHSISEERFESELTGLAQVLSTDGNLRLRSKHQLFLAVVNASPMRILDRVLYHLRNVLGDLNQMYLYVPYITDHVKVDLFYRRLPPPSDNRTISQFMWRGVSDS